MTFWFLEGFTLGTFFIWGLTWVLDVQTQFKVMVNSSTRATILWAAVYDVTWEKARDILYFNRFYKYFKVNIGQFDQMRPSALFLPLIHPSAKCGWRLDRLLMRNRNARIDAHSALPHAQ